MLASLFRTVASLAASAVATELKKPENQRKLAEAAQVAAAKLRDPETGAKVESVAMSGARTLGRVFGNLKNRS
jgi:hypothetical protein